jgi:hypothetical protein
MFLRNLKKNIPKKDKANFLKYCNNYSLFINIITGIVCIVIILVYRDNYNDFIKTEAKVINSQCVSKYKFTKSRHKPSYNCDLTVEYQYNNEMLRNDFETTSGDEYLTGEMITILHDGNNTVKEFNILYYGFYIISHLLIAYLCINTYFRVYHKNNKYVKSWITFTCVENFFAFF